jgi:TM2 domain-containing membrane protein YozV
MSKLKLNYLEQVLQQLNDGERVQFTFFYRQHRKNILVAYLWLIVLGIFGAHKFYLNKRSGWLYLLFCWSGISALLVLLDLFLLPSQVNRYNRQLALELYELTKQLNQQSSNLLLIDNKLRKRRIKLLEWVVVLVIIFTIILPGIAYLNMRLTAHHLEVHYKTNQLDGSQHDSYFVL